MVKVYKATDIGLVRSSNEDSMLCLPSDTYMVADGMGGHAAGEVASHIFIDTARELLQAQVRFRVFVDRDRVGRAKAAGRADRFGRCGLRRDGQSAGQGQQRGEGQ